MFIGMNTYEKQERKQNWAEAEFELTHRPSGALACPVGSSAAIGHPSAPHWAGMVSLSLHQLLRGGDLGGAGISQL